MNKLIKIMALILVVLMLVPCFAACGGDPADTQAGDNGNGNGNGNNGNGDGDGDGDGDGVIDGDEEYPLPPKRDLNRYIYNAFVRSNATGNGSFYCEDFWIDPESGASDALSYAVIARNSEIEKTFNCSIRQTWSTMDSQYTEMKAFYDSDQKYEMAICLGVDAAPCATDGLLSDLKAEINTKHMDLSHEAFDQNIITQMTLGNNLYYLSGDMNISALDTTICTIFNTELFENSNDAIVDELGDMYGDVYKMVEDGKFTFENMMKIADVVTVDKKDDDGSLRFDKGDTIGYYEYTMGPMYYFYGSGMRITDNLDGYPVFEITTEEAEAAYDYIFETFNINLHSDIPRGASGDRAQNFQAGAVLFADYLLWDIRRVLYAAESEVPYGILPIPVMNENDPHHCVVQFQGETTHLWTIPYKRNSIENAAFMFYVMAAYSGKPDSTMDAYYIKTMYMEVARDDGSRASLDIIRGSLEFDIALLYDWGGFYGLLTNAGSATSKQYDTYTSATAMETAEKGLQKTIEDFNTVSEGSGSEA